MKKYTTIFLSFLIILGCTENNKKNSWTLITQKNGTRWYVDFDSMELKSPNVYRYFELADSDVAEESRFGDARKVKSRVTEGLVDCTTLKTKSISYTAYASNMATGMSFNEERKDPIWIGSPADAPIGKIVEALCFPASRKSITGSADTSIEHKEIIENKNELEQVNFECETSKHTIIISALGDGKFRYRSWTKPNEINAKPNLDLFSENEDTLVVDGTDVCKHTTYTFRTGSTEIVVDDNIKCIEKHPPSNAVGNLFVSIGGELKNHYWCVK